ncbi:tetratricopeptide repeat protein [Methanophagales archaeon]|nr:MAG: tetratricopeptide repeat protein [Methanophagales archaeon]
MDEVQEDLWETSQDIYVLILEGFSKQTKKDLGGIAKMKKNEPALIKEIRNAGIGLAVKQVLEGNYGDARRTLKEILETDPENLEIQTLISETYLMENKIKEAKRWLNKVFSKKSDYPRALYNLSVIQSERKEWEKAVEVYNETKVF